MNHDGNGTGRSPRSKRTFSTGQVAKICDVSPRTAAGWFDQGRLKGYRIPGSQDRRIPREQLIRFLRENGMPLGELEGPQCRVLLVGVGKVVADQLTADLGELAAIDAAQSSFEAGQSVESWKPDVVVIDLWLGRAESVEMAARIRSARPNVSLIALVGEDAADLPELSFDHVLIRPFDVAALAERVRVIAEAMGE